MIIPSVVEPASPVLRAAVDALEVAVEDLIKLVGDGHVRDLGAFELVATLQSLEQVRNKLPVLDRALIQHGTEQGVPGVLSERSITRVLMSGLRLSAGSRRSWSTRSIPTGSPRPTRPSTGCGGSCTSSTVRTVPGAATSG